MEVEEKNRKEKTALEKKEVKDRIHRICLLTNLKQLLYVYVYITTNFQSQHVQN